MTTPKSDIFVNAIKKHQSVIDDFEKRIKDLMATDGNVNEEEYDNSEQAIRAGQVREVEMISGQLKFAQAEMSVLKKLQQTMNEVDQVAPGAVVQTNGDTFFVSASIEGFKVGSRDYFGISVDSPIYKVMKGKKAGDTFSVGNKNYKITGVY